MHWGGGGTATQPQPSLLWCVDLETGLRLPPPPESILYGFQCLVPSPVLPPKKTPPKFAVSDQEPGISPCPPLTSLQTFCFLLAFGGADQEAPAKPSSGAPESSPGSPQLEFRVCSGQSAWQRREMLGVAHWADRGPDVPPVETSGAGEHRFGEPRSRVGFLHRGADSAGGGRPLPAHAAPALPSWDRAPVAWSRARSAAGRRGVLGRDRGPPPGTPSWDRPPPPTVLQAVLCSNHSSQLTSFPPSFSGNSPVRYLLLLGCDVENHSWFFFFNFYFLRYKKNTQKNKNFLASFFAFLQLKS